MLRNALHHVNGPRISLALCPFSLLGTLRAIWTEATNKLSESLGSITNSFSMQIHLQDTVGTLREQRVRGRISANLGILSSRRINAPTDILDTRSVKLKPTIIPGGQAYFKDT